jgi:UDP-N-acetyl-2-amino-2-deoxyglucuronate dehydrogenase
VRQRRYTRTIQALRQAIADRALGEIEEAELSLAWNREAEYFNAREWRAARLGGGVLINQASHFLDILLYLLGDVERAAGNIGQVRHAVECEDTACGTLNFVSGARARFELTVAAPKGHNTTSLKLTTRAGVVQVGGRQLDEFVGEVPRELRLLDESEIDTTRGDHAGYMRRVARRIAGDPSAEVVGVEEGARMVRLLETLHTSLGRDDQGLRAWFADRFAGAA